MCIAVFSCSDTCVRARVELTQKQLQRIEVKVLPLYKMCMIL